MSRLEVGSDGWAAVHHGNWGTGAPRPRWERETLGSCPALEDAAQLGEPDYEARAKRECLRFITRIREVHGREPAGVCLRVQSHRHDFGFYYEVEIAWVEGDAGAEGYATRVQAAPPERWS